MGKLSKGIVGFNNFDILLGKKGIIVFSECQSNKQFHVCIQEIQLFLDGLTGRFPTKVLLCYLYL
jgi:hypothetical protein